MVVLNFFFHFFDETIVTCCQNDGLSEVRGALRFFSVNKIQESSNIFNYSHHVIRSIMCFYVINNKLCEQ